MFLDKNGKPRQPFHINPDFCLVMGKRSDDKVINDGGPIWTMYVIVEGISVLHSIQEKLNDHREVGRGGWFIMRIETIDLLAYREEETWIVHGLVGRSR